jgi:ubiquinone/menaquinone biosynthesis C-methylase UbiE
MNRGHAALCSSRRWATFIQSEVLPAALAGQLVSDPALEIGPGYGAATEWLTAHYPELSAVEADPKLAARLGHRYPGVQVARCSAERLPYDDDRFASAFCFTMLHHVPTPTAQDAIFIETHRVLRRGALFVGSDSIASPGLRAFHRHDVYTPVNPHTLADRLAAVGFEDVSVRVMGDWFDFSATAA